MNRDELEKNFKYPEDELPEWYHMVRSIFRELNVYDSYFYENMGCFSTLIQVRYAAERDKKRIDEEEAEDA